MFKKGDFVYFKASPKNRLFCKICKVRRDGYFVYPLERENKYSFIKERLLQDYELIFLGKTKEEAETNKILLRL